ncbi:MAG: extensin family protein [Deltaproteobacteria bacterium]|jgi:hypothetical protein|nr:extensin family protein [Deltaproteobacteria bacterium]MBW2532045.1 extensin family protein [Deltaproteobacteria bacterium]
MDRHRTTARLQVALGWALALALLAPGATAGERRGKSIATFPPDWASAPAVRYADMSRPSCLAELAERKIPYQPVAAAPGVVTPVRILDGVGGVAYRTALPRSRRATNPHDVFDCRLVLALSDLSAILKSHGIDEVLMFSGWRPPRKGWPAGKEAKRHPGGMAIDLFRLGRWEAPAPADGAAPADAAPRRIWLDVEAHFGGRIGSTTCGPKARPPHPATEDAKLLRAIVCEIAAARIFTSILTPNHDRAHVNHIHLDLTPRVKWRILR